MNILWKETVNSGYNTVASMKYQQQIISQPYNMNDIGRRRKYYR